MGMWIGPGATADHWGLAHEFTHARAVATKAACSAAAEPQLLRLDLREPRQLARAAAARVPHQDVHCSEMLVNAPHLYLGSTRDRYCNWQFMEFLKDKYCYSAVNDIWTSARPSNDPFTNIMTTRGWTISQLNDFFGEWAMHNVTWDYQDPAPRATRAATRARSTARKYGARHRTASKHRAPPAHRRSSSRSMRATRAIAASSVPPLQGAAALGLQHRAALSRRRAPRSVTVTFRGVTQAGGQLGLALGAGRHRRGHHQAALQPAAARHRRRAHFCVNAGEALFLVVMATPSVQQHDRLGSALPDDLSLSVHGPSSPARSPTASRAATQHACPTGPRASSNGGGWAPGATSRRRFTSARTRQSSAAP